MGLEIAEFVSDLVDTNPVGATDPKSQGDDHIRLIKTTLKTTFPNADRPLPFPTAAVKTTDFNVAKADFNKTFLVATGGVTTSLGIALPALTSDDASWVCYFIKTDSSLKPILISPNSGTLQSGDLTGLTSTRRCIPGKRFEAFWTGSSWLISRCVQEPIGSLIEFSLADVPVGYELAYGQTLASVATLYPDYNAKKGSGVVVDRRGRVAAGKDDMGGVSANRLTGLTDGVNGDTLGAVGGLESAVLTQAQLPVALGTATSVVTDPGHLHTFRANFNDADVSDAAGNTIASTEGIWRNLSSATIETASQSIKTNTTGISVATSITNAAGGNAHNNVQPTIIENFLVVVE